MIVLMTFRRLPGLHVKTINVNTMRSLNIILVVLWRLSGLKVWQAPPAHRIGAWTFLLIVLRRALRSVMFQDKRPVVWFLRC